MDGPARIAREGIAEWGLPALCLCGMVALSVLLSLTREAGRPGALSLAVFPPWWTAERSVAAVLEAGAVPVETGPVRWTVIAVAPEDRSAPAFRGQGAVLLLNAAGVALCGG